MSPGQVFFIRFVLYLPEWASGDKNLCSTLASCTICVDIYEKWMLSKETSYTTCILKHKDSFGKSENLSKIFFAEILVFDRDYEGKSSSSNGLLWISLIKKKKFIWIIFRIVRRASEQIYTRYQLYFARCNYYQIVNLTSVQSMKVLQKYFG